jgi:hypothetical protein
MSSGNPIVVQSVGDLPQRQASREGTTARKTLTTNPRKVDGPVEVLCTHESKPPRLLQHSAEGCEMTVGRGRAVAVSQDGAKGLCRWRQG